MVELALVLPLLMMLVGGVLIYGLAMTERQQLTWSAQQGAATGATSDGDRCADALDAAAAVLGRPVGPGSTCQLEPGPPSLVRVRLTGSTWHPPLLAPVTIAGSGAAIMEEAP